MILYPTEYQWFILINLLPCNVKSLFLRMKISCLLNALQCICAFIYDSKLTLCIPSFWQYYKFQSFPLRGYCSSVAPLPLSCLSRIQRQYIILIPDIFKVDTRNSFLVGSTLCRAGSKCIPTVQRNISCCLNEKEEIVLFHVFANYYFWCIQKHGFIVNRRNFCQYSTHFVIYKNGQKTG